VDFPVEPGADESLRGRVALVTGGGRRIGATIAGTLHAAGMNIVIQYRSSGEEARQLAQSLNAKRRASAYALRADLGATGRLPAFAARVHARWGRFDALINNASAYFSTPMGRISEKGFDELIDSNVKAPLFLIQAFRPYLAQHQGCIVGVLDTHARAAPRPGFSAYTAAKLAHWSLIESLAVELAPEIRCNGVAPGHVLAEVHARPTVAEKADLADKQRQLPRIPAQRFARPEEIAAVVRFLVSKDSSYVTGVVIPVDGGRRLA